MLALNLLVNAAELAMKADLIRSDKESGGHSLVTLYRDLDCAHKDEIQRRFADADVNLDLRSLEHDGPTVESVLGVYGASFGESSVYQDTRYFAEPTIRLRSESLRGGTWSRRFRTRYFFPSSSRRCLTHMPISPVPSA